MATIVYSGTNCVWCDRVIDLLKEHEDDITKINVDDKQKIKEMHQACGQKVNTVPQVIINGKHIGGFTETERYLNHLK
tara:strand:+ start:119 stop:352 length:234 start_codon:yes stop_codon:yes gene_type:complete